MKADNNIGVLIVDDDALVRAHVNSTLNHADGICAIGEAATYLELKACLSGLTAKQVDNVVILLDFEFQGQDRGGSYIAEQLLRKYPNVNILFVTVSMRTPKAEYFLKLGVKGILLKRDQDKLPKAIACVHTGKRYVSSEFKYLLYHMPSTRPKMSDSSLDLLSVKERNVLEEIFKGKSMRQIADKLNISIDSTYVYKSRAKKKLCIESDIELANRLQDLFMPEPTLIIKNCRVYDMEVAKEIFQGDEKLTKETYKIFVESLPKFLEAFKKVKSEDDFKKLERLTHKFYGGLCFTGAMRLREAALGMLVDLQDEEYDSIDAKYMCMISELKRILTAEKALTSTDY